MGAYKVVLHLTKLVYRKSLRTGKWPSRINLNFTAVSVHLRTNQVMGGGGEGGPVAGVACVAADPRTRENHFALYRRFRASPTQARASEVQKDYSRKEKLNAKKFMYVN